MGTDLSLLLEKIERRTRGAYGCYFLAGFLQVSNKSLTCLQEVSSVSEVSNLTIHYVNYVLYHTLYCNFQSIFFFLQFERNEGGGSGTDT